MIGYCSYTSTGVSLELPPVFIKSSYRMDLNYTNMTILQPKLPDFYIRQTALALDMVAVIITLLMFILSTCIFAFTQFLRKYKRSDAKLPFPLRHDRRYDVECSSTSRSRSSSNHHIT